MQLLKIFLTSALIAVACGAGVYAVVTAVLRISDLMDSARKYRKWQKELEEFEEW